MPLKVMSGPMSVDVCSQECLKSLNHASPRAIMSRTHECVCVFPQEVSLRISEPHALSKVMSRLMSVYVCSQECLKSLNHASQGDKCRPDSWVCMCSQECLKSLNHASHSNVRTHAVPDL
ncbi:hypothetical protein RRG08_067240 [Elysia crispata]|uniref:Uncharacterized protein n=1 Tax=Elysia crispata TaxID=231223 RepID=A0AAE0ZD09_9GAST|nr:hypothetical protein RRG08_067240 [Elysia crispata]